MRTTSKTGLSASPTKKICRVIQPLPVQLRAVAKPAPFVLKPFAGLYNPYPYGCSLLCNHPTDSEAKELLKKAKDSWATEGRNLLLPEEIIAIRSGLEQLHVHVNEKNNFENFRISSSLPAVESVPEELFRRYTETDSRPVTPAPTLASGATRASNSRRCVTPDPVPTTKVQEKTLLILDLRRSHSQETLSWCGTSTLEPPLIRIQHVPTRSGSVEDLEQPQTTQRSTKTKSPHTLTTPSPRRRPRSKLSKEPKIEVIEDDEESQNVSVQSEEAGEEEEEFIRRRGKRRRRKGRDSSRGPPAFQASIDPETQVATIGTDSQSTSARPSLVPGGPSQDVQEVISSTAEKRKSLYAKTQKSLQIDSFLDVEILKLLRRELTEEIVETEFNIKRRAALQEALKAVPKEKILCDELKALKKELNVPPINADLWLNLPRIFTRSSARFELPLDSRTLRTLTPIEYLKENVYITSTRKLLYNCVFNKFKEEEPEDSEEYTERKLSGKNLQAALNVMMGKAMTDKQKTYFQGLVGWTDENIFDFKTFCGICALSERLLAKEYCPQLPDSKTDPCHEVETADFEPLTRKFRGQTCDERLVKILYGIKNS